MLDHAFSAVLSAIWLDRERQKQTMADICSTISKFVRTVNATLDEQSSTAGYKTGAVQSRSHQCSTITNLSGARPGTEDLGFEQFNDFDRFIYE